MYARCYAAAQELTKRVGEADHCRGLLTCERAGFNLLYIGIERHWLRQLPCSVSFPCCTQPHPILQLGQSSHTDQTGRLFVVPGLHHINTPQYGTLCWAPHSDLCGVPVNSVVQSEHKVLCGVPDQKHTGQGDYSHWAPNHRGRHKRTHSWATAFLVESHVLCSRPKSMVRALPVHNVLTTPTAPTT